LSHFSSKTPIDEIHEADAQDYRDMLMLPKDDGAGLVASSANNVCAIAHRLYKLAIAKRWIAVSPFAGLPKGGGRGNNVEVSLAHSLAVLAELTDTQERLLFGLSRWGGLRCPSEPLCLRWGDIDWDRERFTVTAPKTERHPGHERRVVPIFPELMPLFEARFNEAEPGEEWVLPFMRGRDGAGFSYIVKQAIRRAGLEPWPRLWHSMRATRETELAAKHPLHVAATWIGNSTVVAMKHYLSVSEHDFTAAQKAAQTASVSPSHDAPATQAAS
jgi:integrase